MMQKLWGTSRTLLIDDRIEVVRIHVNKGGFSSRHHHKNKWNGFLVHAGKLLVMQWPPCSSMSIDANLESGNDIYLVRPGIHHKFRALTDVIATEVYFLAGDHVPDPADIVRHDEGGVDGTP